MEFPPNHPLSKLSQAECLRRLQEFKNNDWYTLLCGEFRERANLTNNQIYNPETLTQTNGHFVQQQLIGAAPIYLTFEQTVDEYEESLQEVIQQQSEHDNPER